MKRDYVSPECDMINYEPATFILANSVPANNNAARTSRDGGGTIQKGWGSSWK